MSGNVSFAEELKQLRLELENLISGDTLDRRVAAKIISDYEHLSKIVSALRTLGKRIVLTIGSFDLLHPGHVRFLTKAKREGDILIVGLDSDLAIKKYKGPGRPIIPLIERLEMVAAQESVDFATIIDDVDERGKWYYGLLRMIKPDVFVGVEDSYPDEQRREIEAFCGNLKIFPRQAQKTSSSLIIQNIIKANPRILGGAMRKLRKAGRKK